MLNHTIYSRLISSPRFFFSSKNAVTITTPIFYLNADPHIGHLYSLLLSDCVARWHKFKNFDVVFSTGTDEHGQKVQRAASAQNMNTYQFCTKNSEKFRLLNKKFSVSSTHFIRTSEDCFLCMEVLSRQTTHFYKYFIRKQLIKTAKGDYEGYYCVNEESFVTEKDIIKNGDQIMTKTGHVVEWTKEKTHIFDFSPFLSEINEYLTSQKPFIPLHFNELMKKEALEIKDVSISRPKSRVPWAIPVPGSEDFTIYVWLDALTNYLTVLDYGNESQKPQEFFSNFIHIIGKDIVKFHGLYWPNFLKGLGLPYPKRIFVHDHWIYQGKKMSKSFGNVIDPFKLLKKYGEEAIRIYFLSEGPEYYDSEYDEKLLTKRYNDFIEGLVNALNRVFQNKLIKNGEIARISAFEFDPEDKLLIEKFNSSTDTICELMDEYHFRKAYLVLVEKFDLINQFIGKTEVWKIKEEKRKNKIIYMILEMIRITSLITKNFAPTLSADILHSLGIKAENQNFERRMFRTFEKEEEKMENFHYEKDQNFFLKINFENKAKFFRKKINDGSK